MTFSMANQSDINSIHRAHLLTQLAHRLEVARAHQNQALIAALEYEQAQLSVPIQSPTLRDRLQQLWMSFSATLSDWSKVHIEQTINANGKPCWCAYNPQGGQAIFTESEREMRQWIKSCYWER